MPQEFHVLQCFNCDTYQVDIVKKVAKWSCKMCGEKQSLKKVYAKGTGKECRLLVQSLNEQRLTQPKPEVCAPISDDFPVVAQASIPKTSKWAEYLDDSDDKIVGGHCLPESRDSIREASSKWGLFIHTDETTLIAANDVKSDNACSSLTQISNLPSGSKIRENIFEDDTNNLDAVLTL
ncbi:hypothetical protein Zmor_024271 [Zophobas morio]|uniref:MRN complex-interacting protein N-terminal domain-containing protein n=1 Tax=Zophobas morio TaxID=2755281 RepID=A0AA38I0B6_9CUCU|nr:hypothetical protein Zmor_024271 [Zophobas morio]